MIPLALMSAASAVRANWKLIATAGVILALSLYAWRLDSLRAGYKAERDQVRTEYALFREAITAKAAEALAAQKAVNAQKEQEYAKVAQTADAGYNDLRSRYDSLLRSQAGGSESRGASAAAQGDSASVPEIPAAVPVGFQTLPEADWLKLPGLQAYADQCHVWALEIGG